jgi:hypothetical protein
MVGARNSTASEPLSSSLGAAISGSATSISGIDRSMGARSRELLPKSLEVDESMVGLGSVAPRGWNPAFLATCACKPAPQSPISL